MNEWFVRGRALEESTRAGGINAEKGFAFQRAYAAWLLSGLLTSADGIVAIRYEGAQDVDLMKADGSQVYVQVKRYQATELDWANTRKIIQRFVDDLQVAQPAGSNDPTQKLFFRLVAAATTSDTAVLQLLRRVNGYRLGLRIAKELNEGKADKQLTARVRTVLARLTAEVLPEGIPATVFRLMAEARLARFGVPPDHIDEAVRVMLDRVTWRKTTIGADVLEWIAPYLPETHPGSERGSIRPFATRIAGSAKLGELFYASQSDVWTGIAQDLDVPREAATAFRHVLLSSHVSKLLIYGPSGAGKSTLARRVLWDLQREGRLVALELQSSDASDEDWEQARRLAKRLRADGGSHTVLLIDDIHESQVLVQRVNELDGDSDLRVVVTTWSTKRASLDLGPGVVDLPLERISPDEAVAVAQRLERNLSTISTSELTNLLQSGQFIILNIALLEDGTPVRFGRRLLDRVGSEAAHLVQLYLDLCACGAGDRGVPFRLLNRRNAAGATDLLANATMMGLVFSVGTDRVRSGHRVLSEAVLSAAGVPRIPRLLDLAEMADQSEDSERRFAIGLLEDCVGSDSFTGAFGWRLEPLARSLAAAGHYLDIRRCARVLIQANLTDAASQIATLATPDRVHSGPDAAAYRADMENVDAQGAFDHLLEFYSVNPTGWGWRNFLRMAKELDPPRRHRALDAARNRIDQHGLAEGDAKVIIDLLNTGRPLPDWAVGLATSVLRLVPGSVTVARATAQLIMDHLRSAELFRALLHYALPLIGVQGEPLLLARNLAGAARYAKALERGHLLSALRALAATSDQRQARATLLHGCAHLAEHSDIESLMQLVGSPVTGEPAKLNAARHILRKKAHPNAEITARPNEREANGIRQNS